MLSFLGDAVTVSFFISPLISLGTSTRPNSFREKEISGLDSFTQQEAAWRLVNDVLSEITITSASQTSVVTTSH